MSTSGRARRRAKKAARRRASWKAVGFGLAAALVLGIAAFLALAPLRAARAPAAVSGARQVVVTMAGFSPARLTARAGEDLTVTFINTDNPFHTDGGGWHQFRAEALGVDVKIPPGSQRTVTLRNLPAGTYEFYCDICSGGKDNPSMRGILEVTG